jgi:hypothetical protein
MFRPFLFLPLLFLSTASPRFEPVQPDVLGTGGSFVNAWADYDGDGDLDLFVGFGGATANRLYRNDSGMLIDAGANAGVAESRGTLAAAWADYDADGDVDLVVGYAPGPESVLKLYRNDRGKFTDIARDVGVARDSGRVRQVAWIDFDGDGDLDLFVAFRERANALFKNDGGKFADVAGQIGLADTRKTVGAVWFDYDEDGDLDLYTGNMDGDANGLMRNDAGKFTDVAGASGLAWGGREASNTQNGTVRPCAADVDGDGHLDLFTANYGKNGLFLNRGGGKFVDASADWKVNVDGRYDSCALSDFDNDGRIDVYVNGTVTGGKSYRDYLLQNTGRELTDVTPDNLKSLDADHGVQWADFDNDGDEDLALAGTQASGMHLVMRNMLAVGPEAGFLRVAVIDAHGRRNPPGAEVRLFVAGTRQLIGLRLLDTGSGYNAQSSMPAQFGLGERRMVDIEITVPGGGVRRVTTVQGVDARAWGNCAATVRVTNGGRATLDVGRCR